MELCYDGSRYKGWQKQGNTDCTIQGKLESALSRLLGQEVEVNCSGRTDAGAHAKMQVASFRAETSLAPDEICDMLRKVLPEDIGVLSITEASPGFHARLNCTGKTYVYRIWNSSFPNVFERKYMYFLNEDLSLDAMKKAAASLCGRHDFLAFCANRRMKKSSVREVYDIGIEELGHELRFTFSGSGFLYNMVRIMVGTLLEVGRGNIPADSMAEILRSLDRSQAGPTAPAKGLTLWDVKY